MKKLLVLITLPFTIASGLLIIATVALIKKIEEDFEDDDYFWE